MSLSDRRVEGTREWCTERSLPFSAGDVGCCRGSLIPVVFTVSDAAGGLVINFTLEGEEQVPG